MFFGLHKDSLAENSIVIIIIILLLLLILILLLGRAVLMWLAGDGNKSRWPWNGVWNEWHGC